MSAARPGSYLQFACQSIVSGGYSREDPDDEKEGKTNEMSGKTRYKVRYKRTYMGGASPIRYVRKWQYVRKRDRIISLRTWEDRVGRSARMV